MLLLLLVRMAVDIGIGMGGWIITKVERVLESYTTLASDFSSRIAWRGGISFAFLERFGDGSGLSLPHCPLCGIHVLTS